MRRVLGSSLLLVVLLIMVACAPDDVEEPTVEEPTVEEPTVEEPTVVDAPEKTDIKVGIIPISGVGQIFVAHANGYFEDEGLTVELVPLAGGAEIAPAVEAGDLDLGFSNVISIILAHEQGFDFKVFGGGIFQSDAPYNDGRVLVPSDSPLQGYEDLAGATIAVNLFGNLNDISVMLKLVEAGIDPRDVTFVEVGHPDIPVALAEGRVDAAVSAEPFITLELNAGRVRVIDENPYDVIGPRVFLSGWFSTEDWLTEHPNTARAFMRAIERATIDIREDDQALRTILPDYTALTPDLAAEIVLTEYWADVTVEYLGHWVEGLQFLSDISDVVEVSDDFDPASILYELEW